MELIPTFLAVTLHQLPKLSVFNLQSRINNRIFRILLGPLSLTLGLHGKSSGEISLVVRWLKFCTPNAGGLGLIPGQRTRSHVLQLRVHMPQLRPTAAK